MREAQLTAVSLLVHCGVEVIHPGGQQTPVRVGAVIAGFVAVILNTLTTLLEIVCSAEGREES